MTLELRVPVEGDLHDKIQAVLRALYIWPYTNGNQSYEMVDLPKVELADAVLLALGLPQHPVVFPSAEIIRGVSRRPDRSRRDVIPLEVRARIIARDLFRCVKCQADEDLTIDHIEPWVDGGTDDEANLQTLCRSCNSRKGARPE